MTIGEGVAIYAAAVSTVVAALRIHDWRQSRRAPIVVEPRFAFLAMTDGSLVDSININVHNNADHPLRVMSVGLFLQDGSGRTFVRTGTPPGATLPGVIAAHDSGMTYFIEADLAREAGIDKLKPVQAFANISTGETFKSENKPLLTNA